MNKRSRPGHVAHMTSNAKGGRQMAPSRSVGAHFYKPEFVYQGMTAGIERHTYIKGYN